MPDKQFQPHSTVSGRTPPAIPEHELLRRIGEGGYGEVWLARSITGAMRAVKIVYRARFTDDRPYEREFNGIIKFEPLSRSNEGFVDILQVGRDDQAQCFYYVMELADPLGTEQGAQENSAKTGPRRQRIIDPAMYVAHTLRADVQRRGRLPCRECVQLGMSLSLALGHLHRHGLLHRDVKPSNIIFVAGVPKLADIGLVTELAEARSYVGTEGFIPPDGPNSPQADLYSLGKVLYEASMGKDRQEFPEPLTAVLDDPEAPALLELNAVVVKACASARRERYQSGEEMHADLALLYSGRSVKRKHILEQRVAWMSKVGPVVTAIALLATGAFVVQRRQTAEIKRLAFEEGRQRTRAENALLLADENLMRLQLKRAEDALSSDRTAEGLAQLADVLREHPTNHVAAERLWSALSRRNFLLPLIPPVIAETNITVAKLAPDGRHIFVAAESGEARLWDAATTTPVSQLLVHPAGVIAASFCEDGKRLLTVARDGVLRSWTPNGQPIGHPIPLLQDLSEAFFSSDQRWLALVDRAERVHTFNIPSEKFSSEFTPGVEALALLSFSPDGEVVVTAGKTKEEFTWTAQVWDVATGRPLTHPLKHSGDIRALAVAPDRRKLLVGSGNHRGELWELPTGAHFDPVLQHGNHVTSVDFGPDGARVVTGSADRTVQLWDASTGARIGQPLQHPEQVVLVRFSPEGRRLLAVTLNNRIYLWDADAGEQLAEPLALAAKVQNAEFSSDGDKLVVTCEDRRVRLFDLRPSQSLARPFYASASVTYAAFRPDGGQLALADGRDSAWLWNLQSAPSSAVPVVHPTTAINTVQFSPDGSKIVTAAWDQTARVWDAATAKGITPFLRHEGLVFSAWFDRVGGRVVSVSEDHSARVWDAQTGQLLCLLQHPKEVFCAQFSPDGLYVATGCADGAARIWVLSQSNQVVAMMWHGRPVNDVHFSPNGLSVLTTSDDHTARLWDTRSGEPLCAPLVHNNEVDTAAFSPEGDRVATATRGGVARIWNARTGAPLGDPMQHQGRIESVQFSADGRHVATASFDKTARVWDAWTGQPSSDPLTHLSRLYCAIFSPDDRCLATTSADQTARLWEMPPHWAVAPAWLCRLGEAVGGWKLGAQQILVQVDDSEFWRLRSDLLAVSGLDSASVWARWFFAERGQRPISPNASFDLGELEQQCLSGNSRARVTEWLRLVPNHPLALLRAAQWEARGDAASNHLARAMAQWSSYYATLRSPNSTLMWRGRAEVLKKLGDTSAALEALERALALDPQPDLWAAKGHWLESLARPAEACQAFDLGITAITNCPGNSEQCLQRLRLERANVWRQLGRSQEARAEIMALKHFEPRAASISTNLLDLTLYFNARPDEDWHCRRDQGNNLACLRTGVDIFDGVPFETRGIIQLAGGDLPDLEPEYPDKVCGIAVNRICRQLHFLHGTAWIVPEGTTLGHWTMRFEDGSEEILPLVYGKNVRNWQFWPRMPPETGGVNPAWRGKPARWEKWNGSGVRLYKTTWENPHPNVSVVSIDFVSARAGSAPFLLALTAE